ncbi:MAG: hypothetical protein M0Z98_08865 [Actinomycetales bacterium]|nr:hypothetical protein [Actinomycetales bacterium]
MDITRESSTTIAMGSRDHAGRAAAVSVLFGVAEAVGVARPAPPGLADLNLDDVISALAASRPEYDIEAQYLSPLPDRAAVEYRHDVFRDLERPEVEAAVRAFSDRVEAVRRRVQSASKAQHGIRWQQRCWYADAISAYGRAATELTRLLADAPLQSAGLIAVRDHLTRYVGSPEFVAMVTRTRDVLDDLQSISFGLRIRGGKVTVSRQADEAVDYSDEVARVFDRFRHSAPPDGPRARATIDDPGLNHVEAQVVDRVALLWPEQFGALTALCATYPSFVDPTVDRFQREAQFYLAYLDYIAPVRRAGQSFCYPRVLTEERRCEVEESFDLALAHKLAGQGGGVVTNDIQLADDERILVVTGPNHGGKTTFARMVGQVHHLAAVGVPVPGRTAALPLVDEVFTHFERAENLDDNRGKLEDDLRRLHQVIHAATSRSVVILNEVFTSTSLSDARTMGTKILEELTDRDILAVYVTFVDELASLNASTVSLVSQVRDDDPSQRTFKVVRQPANGIAYAVALASRYGLARDQLRERITP